MRNYLIYLNFLNLLITEIILNIDNFVLIVYLINQLPKKQRNFVRRIGLISTLTIRTGLIFIVSYILNFGKISFKIRNFCFSSYEILLLIGGTFLLFKVVKEILSKIFKGKSHLVLPTDLQKKNAWEIIFQIVFYDTFFSFDSVITEIEIEKNTTLLLLIMTFSTCIIYFFFNKLICFFSQNRTIFLFCLIFLFMLSLKLIIKSFEIFISKNY